MNNSTPRDHTIIYDQELFVKNNKSIFELKNHIKSSPSTYEIVSVGIYPDNNKFSLYVDLSLNTLDDIKNEFPESKKAIIHFDNMLLASKGLMFLYILKECDTNYKIIKEGRTIVITESELIEILNNNQIELI